MSANMPSIVRLGYNGRVLKTKNKDAYFGIHKKIAEFMKTKKICIAFDIKNCELDFVKIEELGSEKPDLKKFNQTKLGRELLKVDEVPIRQGNLGPLKPFKIMMSTQAANILYKKAFWAHGKINKSKNFKLDGQQVANEDSAYLRDKYGEIKKDAAGNPLTKEGIRNSVDSLEDFKKKVLGKGTIWCLCPNEMEKRSLAVTNPDYVEKLKPEEQEKCKLYVSIMKNELDVLFDIPYFRESCDVAMLDKEEQEKQ